MASGNGFDDDAENARILAQERDDSPPDYPCPDALWIGPYAHIADIIGIRDWRVWLGITAGLSARAHRNVHAAYHAPLYGTGNWLLVAPSATGKALTTAVCRALVPPDYNIFTSVESGQALAEAIADLTTDPLTGKVTSVRPHPSLLLCAEWTLLLANMDFHGASLLERFLEIHDGIQVDLNRAKQKLRIPNPCLTVCATTTERNYQRALTERLIESGFINRHFTLPGPQVQWLYNSPQADPHLERVAAYAHDHLPLGHTFGTGTAMTDLYSAEAYALDEPFGLGLQDRYHTGKDEAGESRSPFTRLHAYTRRIQMLYAWATRASHILTPHVHAAHAAVATSERFLLALHASAADDLPPYLKAQVSLEEKIITFVRYNPLTPKPALCNRLRRHGGYKLVSALIEDLITARVLAVTLSSARNPQKLLSLHPDFTTPLSLNPDHPRNRGH